MTTIPGILKCASIERRSLVPLSLYGAIPGILNCPHGGAIPILIETLLVAPIVIITLLVAPILFITLLVALSNKIVSISYPRFWTGSGSR